jgi:hypothetical protein
MLVKIIEESIVFFKDGPEIGNMDEGVIEAGKNTGDAEDEFAWTG